MGPSKPSTYFTAFSTSFLHPSFFAFLRPDPLVLDELTGFSDGALDQLKALGLTSEIINWRLRLFLPVDAEQGPALLADLFARYPLLRANARAIA